MANLYTVTATQDQVLFTLPFTYTVGGNELFVFRNGQLLYLGLSYVETSPTSVTISDSADADEIFTFRVPSVTFLGLSGPTQFLFANPLLKPITAPTLIYMP